MGKLSNYLGRLFSSSRRFHPIATTMPQQCHNTIMFYLLVLPAVSAAIAAAAAAAVAPQQQMNVLYILSDDMRADLGSYGIHSAHTPNLDALASRSLVLERAYCQIAVCSPSRQSFLTSLRPDTHGVWNFIDANPKTVQATPGHFRDHGYLTLGLGKIFHENQGQWNKERYWNLTGPAGLPYFKYESNMCPHGDQGGGQCIVADEQIYDYSLRIKTMEYLRHAAQYSKQQPSSIFSYGGLSRSSLALGGASTNVQSLQRIFDRSPT